MTPGAPKLNKASFESKERTKKGHTKEMKFLHSYSFDPQPGNAKYRSNTFQIVYRLRGFYKVDVEVIWLFLLVGCLVVFLFGLG